MTLYNIINELQSANSSMDYLNIWNKYHEFFEENDGEIIFTQNDFKNSSLPSIDVFSGHEKRFKSLFINNNFVFLNTKIVNDMQVGEKSNIKVDYTVSFDSQFASFIEKYFTEKQNSQEKEFEEILYKLLHNDISTDYLPYMLENMSKGVPREGILQNIKEIVNFFHLDKKTSKLLRDMKVMNEQNCNEEFNNIAKHLLNSNENDIIFQDFRDIQQLMYLILMKIIIINKEQNSEKQKITELVNFMHYKLFTVFDRELSIAEKFYENRKEEKVEFFNKVNNIDTKTLDRLKNMSWDLALVRHLERAFTLRPNDEADFFLSYFLTFDQPLSQIIDLYPLKAIVLFNKIKTLNIIPSRNKTLFIEQYKLEEYFSEDALKYRNEHREKNKYAIPKIIIELEEKINAYASK